MSQYSLPFKVASPGSQYSDSASSDVTEPYPTPIAEALESEVVDPPPKFDFHAMTKILASIAEALNESAEAAMFPTVPINNQLVTSPTTSVICQKPNIRGRGMSIVGERLARALAEGRKSYHDSDILSISDRPLHSSGPADNESDSTSDVFSEGGTNKHDSKSNSLIRSCLSLQHALSPHCPRFASRQSCGPHILRLQRTCQSASSAFQEHRHHREHLPRSRRLGNSAP